MALWLPSMCSNLEGDHIHDIFSMASRQGCKAICYLSDTHTKNNNNLRQFHRGIMVYHVTECCVTGLVFKCLGQL